MSTTGQPPTPRRSDDDSEPTATAIEPGMIAEDNTEELDLIAMGDDIVQIDHEIRADGSGRAIVDRVVEDRSAGALNTREHVIRRARRDTVPSVVPSLLAKSMRPGTAIPGRARHLPMPGPAPASARDRSRGAVPMPVANAPTAPSMMYDAAVPAIEHGDVTRPVYDPTLLEETPDPSAGYGVEVVAAGPLTDVHSAQTAEQPRQVLGPVGALVKKACFCLDVGDVAQAVTSAAAALDASENGAANEVANLTDTASGPLARIFTAGPVSKVPVMNRSDAELDTLALDELHWALLRRFDGRLTLDEVFRATKIPAIDALKIAASLLNDGVIRVDDRARG